MKKVNYAVLINENTETKFMPLSFHLSQVGVIDLQSYQVAYESTMNLKDNDETFDVITILESIYHEFNNNHPKNYRNRSLSVGDIVKLQDEYYMVESVGFQKIEVSQLKGCETCYFHLLKGL